MVIFAVPEEENDILMIADKENECPTLYDLPIILQGIYILLCGERLQRYIV